MADPHSIIGFILSFIKDIASMAEDVEFNNQRCTRFMRRLIALEEPVEHIKNGFKSCRLESLSQARALLEKASKFLRNYQRSSILTRMINRRENSKRLSEMNLELTHIVQALQISISVQRWKREDEADREEEVEGMMEMLLRMEQDRRIDQAEIINALDEIRQERKPEPPTWKEIDFVEIEKQFHGTELLGSGGFGTVWMGKWREGRVAVKEIHFHGGDTDKAIRELRREVRVHNMLRHPFIIQLLAASTRGPKFCLVMELATGGNLSDFLRKRFGRRLCHALQVAFLKDIAIGMNFLHDEGILHRDLKSANVLVCERHQLKLCDFGLAKIKAENSSKVTRVGTAPWMAPEVLRGPGGNSTEQSDVYSFGVVCFEVGTCETPFRGMDFLQVVNAVNVEKKRPSHDPPTTAVEQLMKECWDEEPHIRPQGFLPVVERLKVLVKEAGDPRDSPQEVLHEQPFLRTEESQPSRQRVVASMSRAGAARRESDVNLSKPLKELWPKGVVELERDGTISSDTGTFGEVGRALPVPDSLAKSTGSKFTFNCMQSHALEALKTPITLGQQCTCHNCKKCLVAGRSMFGCQPCNYFMCMNCVASHLQSLGEASGVDFRYKCRGQHRLTELTIFPGNSCTLCLSSIPTMGTMLCCHKCDFFICLDCVAVRVAVPKKVSSSSLSFSCPGGHGLHEHKILTNRDSCHWLAASGRQCRRLLLRGSTVLRCAQCNFNVCVACAGCHLQLLENAWEGDLSFNCPQHHGLKEHKSGNATHKCNRQGCDGELPIGSAWLRCHQCDFNACVGCIIEHLSMLS